MQLSAIEAFVAVCELGSFRAAAQSLHLSQPAVSKRIATIETRLGQALFDRLGRRLLLTEAGHSFLPHARRLLAEFADARRAIDNLSQQVGGRLGLALSHHVALHRMPPVLRRYVDAFPDVELDIRFLGSEEACRAVALGSVELAVITLPEPRLPDLTQTEVWSDPMQILAVATHPLAAAAEVTPDQLVAVPALLSETHTTTYRIVARALAAHGAAPRLRLASNNLESLRMLAEVGLGWTALPQTMGNGILQTLAVPALSLRRSLGTVRHPDRQLSNAAHAMLRCLASD